SKPARRRACSTRPCPPDSACARERVSPLAPSSAPRHSHPVVLSVAGVSKRYGSQVVLDDVSWAVTDGARVGLSGPNGAGKSTLLRIIAGEIEPDRGTVALPRGAHVGYLPQHVLGARGVSVRDHALAAFAELQALEAKRAELEHALATVAPDDAQYQTIMDRYMSVCEE